VSPVYQFVEPGASGTIEITRAAGDNKADKLVVQYAPAPAEVASAQDVQ